MLCPPSHLLLAQGGEKIYSVLLSHAAGRVMSATPMGSGHSGKAGAGLAEHVGCPHARQLCSTGKREGLSEAT